MARAGVWESPVERSSVAGWEEADVEEDAGPAVVGMVEKGQVDVVGQSDEGRGEAHSSKLRLAR